MKGSLVLCSRDEGEMLLGKGRKEESEIYASVAEDAAYNASSPSLQESRVNKRQRTPVTR